MTAGLCVSAHYTWTLLTIGDPAGQVLDPKEFLLVASNANSRFQTYAGIDACGERLAAEIVSICQSHPNLRHISVRPPASPICTSAIPLWPLPQLPGAPPPCQTPALITPALSPSLLGVRSCRISFDTRGAVLPCTGHASFGVRGAALTAACGCRWWRTPWAA